MDVTWIPGNIRTIQEHGLYLGRQCAESYFLFIDVLMHIPLTYDHSSLLIQWRNLPKCEKERYEEKAKERAEENQAKQDQADKALDESLSMYPPQPGVQQQGQSGKRPLPTRIVPGWKANFFPSPLGEEGLDTFHWLLPRCFWSSDSERDWREFQSETSFSFENFSRIFVSSPTWVIEGLEYNFLNTRGPQSRK